MLASLGATALLLGLPFVGCGGRVARPNVVLIVIDSLRADALGCYGASDSVSPNLDRLADKGLRFERAIAQAGWNLPSLSSLVTSLHPSEHGQGTAAQPQGATATLAEAFSKGGYRTAAFSEVSWPLLQRGFESFTNTAGPHLYGDPKASNATTTFDAALEWLRDGARKPSFALIHTYEVHSYFMGKPYAQEFARRERPSYRGRLLDWGVRDTETPVGPRVIDALLAADAEDLAYVRSLYRGALAAVDGEIGRLIEALKKQKLDENTIVIVTSSNGEGFRPDLKRVHHGGRLHDDLLHVPLIVWAPGRLAPAARRSLVESIDVAPTLLALAGLDPEPRFKGQPLVEVRTGLLARFSGPRFEPARAARTTAFAEESAMRVTADGRREASAVRQAALYSGWVALIDAGDHVELYDLKADPAEERDVAPGHGEAVAALRADLGREASGTVLAARTGSEVNDQLRSLGYVQ
jgi:choline-sulfatase